MKSPTRYSPEVRQRAVRLVLDHQGEHDSQWSAITSVSSKLGCTAETLRKWVRQAERDRGVRAGFTSEERRRLKELERENRELRRANEILRKASAYLLALCAAQSISAPALVTVGLCDPVADRLGGGLELSTFGRQKWTPIIGQGDKCPPPPLVRLPHAALGHEPRSAYTASGVLRPRP